VPATDRRDEAQSFRWSCFEHRLDASHLRAYLQALPDFEDVLAEEKALRSHVPAFCHCSRFFHRLEGAEIRRPAA
jgi:uncharacterized protein DUF6880